MLGLDMEHKYQIGLDDIINLRDCSHYFRGAIRTCLHDDQKAAKEAFRALVDKLDRVVERILDDARKGEIE